MSGVEVLLAVVLGLVVNELTDVSPWLARKLVAWSARQRYGAGTARAGVRAEELTAVINDRPGKLFKLGSGLRFASAAAAVRLRRLVSPTPDPAGEPSPEELLPLGRILPVGDEPTALVARYLFPTERYRGEWRRHWIHLAKRLAVTAAYAVLGGWAAVARLAPRHVGWVLAAIAVLAALLTTYHALAWYLGRFVITHKRLMSAEGVLFRRVAMIPLLRVTDLRYTQSPIGRTLDYGTFTLESASRRNAIRKIADLPHPNELYLRLVEEMYEPTAVEARLGRADVDDGDRHPPARHVDLTLADQLSLADDLSLAGQPSLADQLSALSAQLTALATAIDRLVDRPGPVEVDGPDAATLPPASSIDHELGPPNRGFAAPTS